MAKMIILSGEDCLLLMVSSIYYGKKHGSCSSIFDCCNFYNTS